MGLKRKEEEYCIHALKNSKKTDKMLVKASDPTVLVTHLMNYVVQRAHVRL